MVFNKDPRSSSVSKNFKLYFTTKLFSDAGKIFNALSTVCKQFNLEEKDTDEAGDDDCEIKLALRLAEDRVSIAAERWDDDGDENNDDYDGDDDNEDDGDGNDDEDDDNDDDDDYYDDGDGADDGDDDDDDADNDDDDDDDNDDHNGDDDDDDGDYNDGEDDDDYDDDE